LQTKTLVIETAVCRPDSGPGGVGVVARDVHPTVAGRICEQAYGSIEELTYRAVLRALDLGKRLGLERVSILCPNETIARQINRELPVPQESRIPMLYVRVKALMYTYKRAEIIAAPEGRVRAARKLAMAGSRIPVPVKKEPRTLFTP
jgi:ribonuclease HI